MRYRKIKSSHHEERLYNELNSRKTAISGEEKMTINKNVSPRIKELADHAHVLMNRKRNPLSVRKACDAAGLSIASYYKVYPTNQSEGTVVSAAVKKEGSPARKKRRATSGIIANPSRTQEVIGKNKDTINKMKEYIAKLEHRLVKLTLDDEE